MQPNQNVGKFFDSLSDEYTEVIERCFPRYREMLWAVVDYLPAAGNCQSILDLGCGTGNLSQLIHERYPDAALTCVDISEESLLECRARLSACDALVCEKSDMQDVDYSPGSFDLIVSSIAIHHLPAAAKQKLYQRIYQWLASNGVLCFADQFAGATPDVSVRHQAHWKALSMQAGSTEEEWAMWMQHQSECDHHDSLSDQLAWLHEAGFQEIDVVWRFLLWTVLQARK